MLRFLQRELGRRLADVMKATSEYHLLTVGKAIFLVDNQKMIIDLLKNSRQPIISVCLTDQVKRLAAEAKQTDMFKKRAARENRRTPRVLCRCCGRLSGRLRRQPSLA